VHIGALADVVSEVPARVAGRIMEDDVIGVPQPAVAITCIVGCHAPEPAIEPEAVGEIAMLLRQLILAELLLLLAGT